MSDASEEVGKLAQLAHTMSYHLLSQGLVEAVHIMSSLDKKLKLPSIPAEDPLDRGDLSPFGPIPPRGGRGQSCSTPQDEPDPLAQVPVKDIEDQFHSVCIKAIKMNTIHLCNVMKLLLWVPYIFPRKGCLKGRVTVVF